MTDFKPSSPEKEEVTLFLSEANLEIKNFTEYSFTSNFLVPSDGFSFTIGAERLSDAMQEALVPGVEVKLTINGVVQGTGFIDSIEIGASRSGGSTWRIEGRDKLAQAVDSCADPTVTFKEGVTLEDALVKLFTPFGWTKPAHFSADNTANRDLRTNNVRQKRGKSEGKGFGRKAIRQYKLHQGKPYPREGVFDFATRMSQRLGLWIWLSADGETLIVSQPNFEQEPLFELVRTSKECNILEGSVKHDISGQPSMIIADSYSQGGEFGRGRAKAYAVNPVIGLPNAPADAVVKATLDKYKEAVPVEQKLASTQVYRSPFARILYLHDDESVTPEQLQAFVQREMALYTRKSVSVHYTVEGHGQHTPGGFAPWTVDTTVKVLDEPGRLDETLYVLGRTFNKSRSGGTTTQLELIRLYSMVFSDGGTQSK